MKKFIKNLMGMAASLVMAGALSPVLAQTAATPAATPAATAAATPAPPTVVVDGMVEGYYSYNWNNAEYNKSGVGNTGYYYNTTDGSYSLGLAELKATATQGLASGHLVLAYGQELNPNGGLVASPGFDVEQAYVSYAPSVWTLSAGRFVTWMGNEVIETTGNWNVSRSLLFVYTIPLLHNGVSVAFAPDSTIKFTGYATNGWNNSVNVGSIASVSSQTFGLQLAWTPNSTWSITLNGIDGPGADDGGAGTMLTASSRYVAEAIIGYNPTSDWSFALDAEAGGADGIGNADFWGADIYAKYALASDYSVALRLEEVADNDDSLGLYGIAPVDLTGNKIEGRDATLTITHNLTAAFTVSLEGRYDYVLGNGTEPAGTAANPGPFAGFSPNQFTTTLDSAIVF
jgi:hypothetical protein